MNNISISKIIKLKIAKEYIEPEYIYDIKRTINGKRFYKTSGQIFETISKILISIGCILSFASGYNNNKLLSFFAGCTSTISLTCLQLSSFFYKEYKKHTEELNIILKKLNIDTMPIIDDIKNIDKINKIDKIDKINNIDQLQTSIDYITTTI
jgi:hypothetical protein